MDNLWTEGNVGPRAFLLAQITEYKDQFAKYSQLCANYGISPDPIAIAKHQARLTLLQSLLSEKAIVGNG